MGAGDRSKRLRNTVEAFILKEPLWFLYIRILSNTRCPVCYNDFSRMSKGWCDRCFGTGARVRLEKVPVRRTAGHREELDLIPVGYVSQTHPVIYTPYWLHPNENSLFVEVDGWRGTVPLNVFRVYRVMIALPMKQSELSYYACGCNPADFSRDLVLRAIRQYEVILRTEGGALEAFDDCR